MIDERDLRIDMFSTAAASGYREGVFLLTHIPTGLWVREDLVGEGPR